MWQTEPPVREDNKLPGEVRQDSKLVVHRTLNKGLAYPSCLTPFHQGEGSCGRNGLTFGKQPLGGFGRVTLQVPSPVLNTTINCSG